MAIYKDCREEVDISFFTIALYESTTYELASELDIRGEEVLPKFRVPLGDGLNSWVFRNGRLLNLGSTQEETRFGIVAFDDGKPTESWLGVPMIARDRVIGVISVQSYRRHTFLLDDEILLTTNMSHELLPARLYKFVENIHIVGNHLLDLINDILDLSKIEAGRIELQPHQFDLRTMVTSVERVVKGVRAEASVTLVTSIDDGIPPVVLEEGRRRDHAQCESTLPRRRNIRDSCAAKAARARRRRRRALDDQVPRRAQRCSEWLACLSPARRVVLASRTCAKNHRPGRLSLQLLARAARYPNARRADAGALRERFGSGGVSLAPSARRGGLLPGTAVAPWIQHRAKADR